MAGLPDKQKGNLWRGQPGVFKEKMRDLVFKNLTSNDRKRKIIASHEISDKEGVRSIIRRHFVCIVREVKDTSAQRPEPYLYVLKKHDSKGQQEKFFCKIKGSIYAVNQERLFLIVFMHSLNINLTAIPSDLGLTI